MSNGKSYAARMKNHQWRWKEPTDQLWYRHAGYRPSESLYETLAPPEPPGLQPWGHLPVLPMAAIGGNSLLESRLHALVGAMSHFMPSVPGFVAQSFSLGLSNPPLMAAHPLP